MGKKRKIRKIKAIVSFAKKLSLKVTLVNLSFFSFIRGKVVTFVAQASKSAQQQKDESPSSEIAIIIILNLRV